MVTEGLLNRVEMAFRAYDPCFGCATHTPARPDAAGGDDPRRGRGEVVEVLQQGVEAERERPQGRTPSSSASATRSCAMTGSAGASCEAVEAPDAGRAGRAEFDCVALGGLALMERLVGYDRAILVDAIQTKGGAPGAVYRLTLDDLPTLHANAVHDASLPAALELGRSLGAHLPDDVAIVAIEAAAVLDFGEVLTPEVAAAVPRAADMLLALIRETDGS